MKPVHCGLERLQWRLQIDGRLAREILAGLPPSSNPFDVQGILIGDIERRDFRLNVGRYCRVSNNITSIKRELRAALNVDGLPLSHADSPHAGALFNLRADVAQRTNLFAEQPQRVKELQELLTRTRSAGEVR